MKKFAFVMVVLVVFSRCGKKDNGIGGGGGMQSMGSGSIYVDWATDGIQKIDLGTGVESTVMPENTSLYSYYISQDGQRLLTSASAPVPNYDANLYTLTNLSDGTVVSQFSYYPAGGDVTSSTLSPDGATIAVVPTYDEGIVIMDLKGKVSHNLTSFNGRKFGATVVWMPDGSILCTTEDGLLRTNTAFTQASLVKSFTFSSWGDVAASVDGAKIALRGGNHIWLMNADGSGLVQVTTSTQAEALPVFSPDGKYLLVGTNYRQSGPFGYLWDLKIIPADGQQYNVDNGADQRVVPVIPNGKTQVQSGSGRMFWR